MGLTSPVLPYLVAAATGVVLLAIIVTWPWLARRRAVPIASRILSLLLLQALSLGLIFVIVNRANDFYASWQDLLGSNKSVAHVSAAHASTVASQQPLVVLRRVPVHVAGYPSAGGSLETVQVRGALSGITAAGHIYLPAGYRAHARHPYPVLVAISDAPAGSSSPYAAGNLADSAAVQMSTGALRPMVIAMLPATLAPRDDACLNVPARFSGTKVAAPAVLGETFFAQDVPQVLTASYDLSSRPANWALLGDQSGGYCALQLALDNSYVFSTAAAPRGAYSVPPGHGAVPGSPLFREQDSLLWQLSHLPMQPVSVLFAGPGQVTGAGAAAPFAALAHRPLTVSLTDLGTGPWPLAHVLDWIGTAINPEIGRKG